jgi:hypothetical protein
MTVKKNLKLFKQSNRSRLRYDMFRYFDYSANVEALQMGTTSDNPKIAIKIGEVDV